MYFLQLSQAPPVLLIEIAVPYIISNDTISVSLFVYQPEVVDLHATVSGVSRQILKQLKRATQRTARRALSLSDYRSVHVHKSTYTTGTVVCTCVLLYSPNCTPDTIAPVSSPYTALTPKNVPVSSGARMTSAPGASISLNAACVEIATQRAYSGRVCREYTGITVYAIEWMTMINDM
jgi:hypothetical protein